MLTFQIDDSVREMFPEAQVRLVAAYGVNNSAGWIEVDNGIGSLESDLASGTWSPSTETDLVVSTWHEAYRRFGANPRRARPSLDALGRRLAKSGTMPRINPAVDAYNEVSLRFGTPAGAFDAQRLGGMTVIRPAREGDSFTPLGEPEVTEVPKKGEIVYANDAEVLTRYWNHRDSDKTKVTEDSVDVIFILERISAEAVTDSRMDDAQQALFDVLAKHSETLTTAVLSSTQSTTALPQPRS